VANITTGSGAAHAAGGHGAHGGSKRAEFLGTGRRKESVARVRMSKGTGIFTVNGRELDDYFVRDQDRQEVLNPLRATKALGRYDVRCTTSGGGFTGQAGAIVLGIARAMIKAEPDTETVLRTEKLMSRDARMKERKKYGQKGARARFQFSKR
jgi:small subunit ribosomal protein S9